MHAVKLHIRTYTVPLVLQTHNVTYKANLLGPGYFSSKLNMENSFHLPWEDDVCNLADSQLFLLRHCVLYVES